MRYDNLKEAVTQVLGFSRQRTEAERWIAFRSHWGIQSFYRNHFVPVPEVATLTELNELVDRRDLEDKGRRIRSRTRTISEYFTIEQPQLKPLPVEPFETIRWFTFGGNIIETSTDSYRLAQSRAPAGRAYAS
ncbi:hypothetical protein ACWD3J_39845 [Streptomyces sp. NPDC002755]